jgi:hypothetical protein
MQFYRPFLFRVVVIQDSLPQIVEIIEPFKPHTDQLSFGFERFELAVNIGVF